MKLYWQDLVLDWLEGCTQKHRLGWPGERQPEKLAEKQCHQDLVGRQRHRLTENNNKKA